MRLTASADSWPRRDTKLGKRPKLPTLLLLPVLLTAVGRTTPSAGGFSSCERYRHRDVVNADHTYNPGRPGVRRSTTHWMHIPLAW